MGKIWRQKEMIYLKTLHDNYQDLLQNFLNFIEVLYKLGASLGWFCFISSLSANFVSNLFIF